MNGAMRFAYCARRASLHVAPLSWQLAQQLLRNPYDVVFAVVQAR
jgi:hypothetical protein